MMPSRLDLLIKNAVVYDGTLSAPRSMSIGISGDLIAYLGHDIPDSAAADIVDAEGLAAAPGFIDTHAHSDFTILSDPRAFGKISQGITTEITGNCGMSAAPMSGAVIERREEDLRSLGIKDSWSSFEEYFSLVESQGTGINIAALVGHGNLRGAVVGYDERAASDADITGMKRLMQEAFEQGVIGFSTGLIYPPGIYSDTPELISLSRSLCSSDLIYTSHMRSEGNKLEEAIEEVIRIGREAGVRVHVSHIKTAGQKNWHKAEQVISRLMEVRKEGLRLTCDRYPYTASSTDLDSILPAWVFAGGNDEELKRLNNPEAKRRIEAELKEQVSTPGYWEKILISSVENESSRWMEGRTVGGIASAWKTDGLSAFFRILIEERLRVGAIFLSMSEDNLRKFLSLPFCMIGSDSSARCFDGPTVQGKPHPRTFGTFPRLYGRYVREEKLLSLSGAIHKSTMLAAETFRLRKRGQIKEGYYADLVIFDPGAISDLATFEAPYQQSDGIRHVLVNGVAAVSEGRLTGKLSGRVLRHGGN